ncbi:MAG TPA: RsmE family RNA methyltransferase, partial [Nordella sp.]|nr:RsmE family RNA methyltransferase [Nordella sp.]
SDGADTITLLKGLKLPVALLVGPEGGFTAEEREGLRRLPFVTVISLGPRIMRADTAGTAALAVVQAVLGDWHP